ncbi:hypothetical protein BDN67DRAFT_911956 [Paxillus ammoniavirescens]|nr:hypothetical protein BDN67DRAFT_911956 [Paxillus ammoniavirescens]
MEIIHWCCLKVHAGVFRRNNTITHRGRAIRLLISLFDDVENLVAEYDRQSDSTAQNLGEDPDHLYLSSEELLTYLPWMKRKIINCDPDELDDIFKQLRKGADGARGDDMANLKGAVVTWLAELFHPIDPPLNPSTEGGRGLVHDTTGKLICPAEYNWLLDLAKEKIRDRDPGFLITTHSWPLFLYRNFDFDPTDVEEGLFYSSLMAFKYLFTSPSSAKDVEDNHVQPGGPARQQASSRYKTATKNHLHFALSCVNSWRNTDGDFDYTEFYNNIVNFFEVVPGSEAKKRVHALLAWWNRKVFGKDCTIVLPAAAIQKCSVSHLAAQHLGKEGGSP